jgi:hypothetical protein
LIDRLLPEHSQSYSGIDDPLFAAAVAKWQLGCESASIAPPFAASQKEWDKPLLTAQESRKLSAVPEQVGKARVIDAAAPRCGVFRLTHLCSSLSTRLDYSSLRTAVAL